MIYAERALKVNRGHVEANTCAVRQSLKKENCLKDADGIAGISHGRTPNS